MDKFTEFSQWKQAGVDAGLSGPHRIQGHDSWQFTDKHGQAAVWNGSSGHIFRGVKPVEAKPVPPPFVPPPKTVTPLPPPPVGAVVPVKPVGDVDG